MKSTLDPSFSKTALLAGLRAVLAEKFPQAPVRPGATFAIKWSGLGGLSTPETAPGEEIALQRGAITEASGSCGSGALFLEALLGATESARAMMALVDGTGCFDPAGEEARQQRLKRLLWVLCKEAQAAIKVADLLLRDGNMPLVVLDLQMTPSAELRRIPPTTWYRFQRIMEQSTAAFVVLTPRPMVGSATERLCLQGRWSLRAMRRRRDELPLRVEQVRRRQGFQFHQPHQPHPKPRESREIFGENSPETGGFEERRIA